MSIKYHQNGIGNEYGADGKLTDNWNPSTDYGNEYTKVYIRINVSNYDCAAGFFNSEAEREKFYTEASKIIKSFGILEDCGYSVEHSKEKQAYLYVHPQNISGVIRKNDVKKVTEAFVNMENVSVRWVDLYATVYVMTDAEYNEYLTTKKADVRKMLFEHLKTTRTNKYISQYDISHYLADKIRLHRLGLDDGKHGGAGQTIDYINDCIAEMATEGFLKQANNNNGIYVRSINKTEQKAFKCFTA
jgi:hypothetical protein